MKTRWLSLIILFLLAACDLANAPGESAQLPTVAELPTLTPSDTPRPATPTDTLTPTLTETPTLPPSPTPDEPTLTFTPSITLTFTPSATITDTITPTPSDTATASATPSPTLEVNLLLYMAALARNATVLPQSLRPSPPPIGVQPALLAGTPGANGVIVVTPASGPTICSFALPGSLSAAITADPTLPALIGCSLSANATAHGSAVQNFERGAMIWLSGVNGGTGTIYTFFNDGRFRRFDDTFVDGVDPATGGETPPAGLFEPGRGFGKVWRSNSDVRNGLGWAASVEQGGSANSLGFERGRAIYLTQRGDTFLLIEDPGGLSGTWRSIVAAF